MKLLARIALAWRQARAGLAGRDIEADCKRWSMMLSLRLMDFERKARSTPLRVCTIEIETPDYGRDYPHRNELRFRLSARTFTVPVAFLTPIEGREHHLAIDYAIDKYVLKSMDKARGEMLMMARKRAAADLGIALVCGIEER